MPRRFTSHKGATFTVDDKPLHSGGEGAIHLVLGTGKKLVAKIYHTRQKAQAFHQKVLFMIQNPPFGKAPDQIKEAIVWPVDLLYDQNEFVGYVMPMVDQGIKLFALTLPGSPHHKHGPQWKIFDKSNPDAFLVRMKVCYNLAMAVDLLHKSGKYVLVDLKPENVLIKPNGHFSIIDLDSIQISQQKQLLFSATAYSPGYAPPEFQTSNFRLSKSIIPENYDNFSIAVILYQVIFSIHPFQASHAKYTTIEENIQHGLFVHGSRKNQLHVIPSLHDGLNGLPNDLQKQFIRALDHGHINPDFRPSADEWAGVLLKEIKSFVPGKYNLYVNLIPSANSQANSQKRSAKPNVGGGVSLPNIHAKQGRPNQKKNVTPKIHITNIGLAQPTHKGHSAISRPRQRNSSNSLNSKKTKKVLSQLGKRNVLKTAAIVLLFIFAGFALWDTFFSGKMHSGIQPQNAKQTEMSKSLSGQYYGFIQFDGTQRQVAYLQIRQSEENIQLFVFQIITSVVNESKMEEVFIDNEEKIIKSNMLGEGAFNLHRDGRIILTSTDKNSMLWYFEK